jgi:hypothetical protein
MDNDRRGWLTFFGIVHIGIGLVCLLLLFGTAVGAEMIAKRPGTPQPNIAQSLLFDALATFYFVAIGVGSIRARRWARDLALAVSAVWLIAGVIACAVSFIVFPHILVIIPPSQEHAVVTMMSISLVLTMILLPLAFTLFYRMRSVRSTCESHDPKPRWTERAPVPVLALALTLALGALMMIVNLNARAYFLFGMMLTGATASIAIVALAVLFAVIAVQLFRLRESAWWVLVLLHLVAATGMVMAFTRGVDVNGYYDRIGQMTPQIRAMHLETLTSDPKLWAIIVVGWLAYLAFLVWLRRYFVTRRAAFI